MARSLIASAALAVGACTAATPQPVPPTTTTSTDPVPPSTTSPTVAAVEPVVVEPVPPPAPVSSPVERAEGPPDGVEAVLACIAAIESGGDYGAVSPAGHRGAHQFAPSTWRGAVARAGYPEWADRPANEAPPEVQDAAAAQLLAERGLSPWPTPAGRC